MTEVQIAAGALRGEREDGIAVFRGIPFAEPPVGALRFGAPRPVRPWDGVRTAVAFGPRPPQGGAFGTSASSHAPTGDDWLTVNVWSPAPDLSADAGLPVMVWIHGGGYEIGASGVPEYDGSRLARFGGVVVVTFNYRLGIEGFAQIEGAPANRGLLDQVAALEWVRTNIRAFGGDPGRVTVFGESSGAGSVAALLAMPRAKGLFHRAIAQSVQGTFFSTALAAEIAESFAAELGLRPTLADFSTVAPAQLPAAGDAVSATMAQHVERWGQIGHRSLAYSPVIDGDVLPVTPWQALTDGAGRDVELIAGHTRDEYRLFTALVGEIGGVTPEQADSVLRVFAPGPDGARRYRDGFPTAGPDELYELVYSDWLFRMPSLHLAEAQTAGGGRAHVYELTWSPDVSGTLGACHGIDVPLVFGNLSTGLAATLIGGPSLEAEALSAHLRTAWTAFAAHGDPGWPAYDLKQRLVQLFDTRPAVTAYPEEASRLIWKDHVFSAAPLIG